MACNMCALTSPVTKIDYLHVCIHHQFPSGFVLDLVGTIIALVGTVFGHDLVLVDIAADLDRP